MNSFICAGLIASMLSTPIIGVSNNNNINTSSIKSSNTSINQRYNFHTNINTKKIIKNNNTIMSDLNIPVLKGLSDLKTQEKINNILKNDILNFNKSIIKESINYFEEAKKMNFKGYKYSCTTDFKVCKNTSNFLSIYVDFYVFSGGAHGSTIRKGYNFDLKTGKLLTIEDLTSNKKYKNIIDNYIKGEILKNPEYYFKDSFKGITKDQTFYIKDNNLIICFQQYDIACYAVGLPEFIIPLSNLK